MSDTIKIKASQHESYGTFTLISVLIPFVGIVLGIVYLTKESKLDKKLGEHLLAISVLSSILTVILWSVYASYQQQQVANNLQVQLQAIYGQ